MEKICQVCIGRNVSDEKYKEMYKVQAAGGEKIVCGVCVEDYAHNPKEPIK